MQFYVAAAVADRGIGPAEYPGEKLDTIAGSIFCNLISIFIIVATAAAIHVRAPLESAKQAAQALTPVAGRFATQLFEVGLQFSAGTKSILEERLESVLLEQRLHFERRLPLLAVIATAAPLMGLLGTVMGMVKTFALITVFGTLNAGKLASGISEVLIATELGLVVAIPTLVAHGFLANSIQKNLSLLERYALEFVTSTDIAKNEERAVTF